MRRLVWGRAALGVALWAIAGVACDGGAPGGHKPDGGGPGGLGGLGGAPGSPLPDGGGACPEDPPKLNEAPVIGDASSSEIIIHDSDVFWWNVIGGTAADERAYVAQHYYDARYVIGRRAAAMAQMYDLIAPVDSCRASHYLEHIHVIADELLKHRDDKIVGEFGGVGIFDPFHGRVMAAWGNPSPDRDDKWDTSVDFAGLYTYPMAAFARRVAANPTAFSSDYQNEAIRFTTAVFETYDSFHGDLVLQNGDGWAYYAYPTSYSTLKCDSPRVTNQCANYRAGAGKPESWNENLIFMKSLAEAAVAADSALYRSSPASPAKLATLRDAQEAPRVIAGNVKFFIDHVNSPGQLRYWSGDGAAYYVWKHGYGNDNVQDTPHAQFELGALAVIHEHKVALDDILTRAGRSERIGTSPTILKRFATTFLRLIWNTNNTLGLTVDGATDGTATKNWNQECAGFIELTPHDPWVWVRCRDSVFAFPSLREDNYAALLRYRVQ